MTTDRDVFTDADVRRLRRKAAKQGLQIHMGKDCYGLYGFEIVNAYTNVLETCGDFHLSFDDVEKYLDDK